MEFTNWQELKAEYISDENTSYEKLAKKYGITKGSIYRRASKEKWLDERKRHQDRLVMKTLNAVVNNQAKRAERLLTLADKLLDKVEKAIDDFEMVDLMSDRQALRQITGALKDVKDIQMIKSDADLREQAARIQALEKQVAKDDDTVNTVRVVFEDGDGDYNE